MERERFKWPNDLDGAVVTLSGQQLNWLLDGYDIRQMRPHKALKYRTLL
ncbi:MAG: IS66 family insertion sequence element accessory protein TnpB [Candidatus Sedimenticola endophacoides]